MSVEIHTGIIIQKRQNKKAFSGRLRPLRQVYRSNELGLPVSLFEDVTGLDKNELYRKLVPSKFLTLVKQRGKSYILVDVYWKSLLDLLREKAEIVEPSYTKLKNCKTV